jgi:hypothetical protein
MVFNAKQLTLMDVVEVIQCQLFSSTEAMEFLSNLNILMWVAVITIEVEIQEYVAKQTLLN